MTEQKNHAIVAKEVEEFQGGIIRAVAQHKHPYIVTIKNQEFVLFPDTFNPNYAKASLFLLENLGVQRGDVVVDPFCGAGVDAIFAAINGARKVVAIDKFTMPVLCTQYNVYQLGLDGKIDVRKGDLFEPLKPEEKFDLVIANPPFRASKPESIIDNALKDESYTALKKFFLEVGKHLTQKGRIRLVFSSVGDINLLEKLATENNFDYKIVAQTYFASSVVINVYEMKRRNKNVSHSYRRYANA